MKKVPKSKSSNDLRREYDLSKLKAGVRGKYYRQAISGTNLMLIEPELANAFPDTEIGKPGAAAIIEYCGSRDWPVAP
jgi:hypothetical protein